MVLPGIRGQDTAVIGGLLGLVSDGSSGNKSQYMYFGIRRFIEIG